MKQLFERVDGCKRYKVYHRCGIAPTCRIALLDKPTIVWDFRSLLIGLQMMFSFMMAEDKTPLRMCDSCDTIFVANRKTQHYCCDKCRRKGE